MKIPLTLNNKKVVLEADPFEKLLTVLRREKLFSAKQGCAEGRCGSCTVLLDDKPVPSCLIPVGIVRDATVVTLEYFSTYPVYQDIMKGFAQAGVHLCGFCNAGKIFTAYHMITTYFRPDREQLYAAVENLTCPCTERDTLINGILYAVAFKHAREGKDKHGTR